MSAVTSHSSTNVKCAAVCFERLICSKMRLAHAAQRDALLERVGRRPWADGAHAHGLTGGRRNDSGCGLCNEAPFANGATPMARAVPALAAATVDPRSGPRCGQTRRAKPVRTSSLSHAAPGACGGHASKVDPQVARELAGGGRRQGLRSLKYAAAASFAPAVGRVAGPAGFAGPRQHGHAGQSPRGCRPTAVAAGPSSFAVHVSAACAVAPALCAGPAAPASRSKTTSTACTGDDLARLSPRSFDDHARLRRRDGHRRLVGHHLDHRLVFLDDARPACNEPLDDLALGNAFADIGKLELVACS
jgi:hypothetical protein